jgi:hypothetical protein
MKCEGSGRTVLYLHEEYEEKEIMNVLDSLLLQGRLLWNHADNEDGTCITLPV